MKELELKEREVALKEAEAQHDAIHDMEKLRIEAQKIASNIMLQEERMEFDTQRTAAQTAARIATQLDSEARKERMKGADIGLRAADMLLQEALRNLQKDAEEREAQNDRTAGDATESSEERD